LFSQSIIAREVLEQANGVIEAAIIPVPVPVQPQVSVSSVATTDAGLVFTDTDGVSSLLHDNGSHTIVGVTAGWQSEHAADLEGSLTRLASMDRHAEVLVLAGDEPSTISTAWFSPTSSLIFRLPAQTPALLPAWLGISPDARTGFVYYQSNGELHAVTAAGGPTTRIGTFPLARRRGDALTLSVGGPDTFSFPVLRSVRYVGAAVDAGATLVVTADMWASYEALAVSFVSDTARPLAVRLDGIAHPEHLKVVQSYSDDLVIVDPVSMASLTLVGAARAPGSAVVLLSDGGASATRWSAADILRTRDWLAREYNLSGWLILTLENVSAVKRVSGW
jgi:hypothetical protein